MADQGTEKGLGDDSIRSVHGHEEYESDDAYGLFLYPRMLMLPGMLQILFNALQDGIQSIVESKAFLDQLRVVEAFLSNIALRTAFAFQCLGPEDRSAFLHYSTTHIDWKWEFLSKALTKLTVVLRLFFRFFDVAKIQGAANETVKDTVVKPVAKIIASEPYFPIFCELYLAVGLCIDKYAKKLETCWCHEAIWSSGGPYKRRHAQFVAETGHGRCAWKGRMGPWWIAVGIAEMIVELGNCTSEALQTALAALDAFGQAIALRRLQLIRSRIIETLQQKLQFLYTIPYRAIGIFWCEHGGTLEVCKQIARECMNEYDEAIRNNLVVHRVAHFLFHPSTPCRIEMQLWVDSVLPLRAFLALFRQLLEYALSPFSERSIESVHAIIKRIG